ncbi:Beta-1,2-xylosyltransferase RCN11 [Camellia lanceoleosa]|uniref:Beta-1,2-xylosyltransferase RCN11 n=1 Tax=Camellia lanceoleosa TaxID=1840588 RepID=A0ACC0GZW7_9ERIC|nr:Beta-1,2-xylosyltransferase RCN11 [Camellia lanceoleosa]
MRNSICEGGRVRMHPDKIRMSIGGERLEAVMGRGERLDRSSHGRHHRLQVSLKVCALVFILHGMDKLACSCEKMEMI